MMMRVSLGWGAGGGVLAAGRWLLPVAGRRASHWQGPHRAVDAAGSKLRAGYLRCPRIASACFVPWACCHADEDEAAAADPLRQEKRRRFKEARKQHYNMREQLQRWVRLA